MAFDKLLESLPPRSTLGLGTTDGDWVYVGPNKNAQWRLTIGGDVTGTNPTLDVTIQGSTDGVGASDATLATFPQQIDENVGYVASTTPRPEVPGEWGAFVTAPTLVGGTAYPWQRVHAVVGGTSTPVFPLVSCDIYHIDPDSSVQSGGAVRDTTVYTA